MENMEIIYLGTGILAGTMVTLFTIGMCRISAESDKHGELIMRNEELKKNLDAVNNELKLREAFCEQVYSEGFEAGRANKITLCEED